MSKQNQMKLFQPIQTNLALLGISSNQPHYFNQKSMTTLFIYSSTISLCIVFLFFTANNFLEYTLNVYVTTTAIAVCIAFMAILFHKENIFELIQECEKFVNESEFTNQISLSLSLSNAMNQLFNEMKIHFRGSN